MHATSTQNNDISLQSDLMPSHSLTPLEAYRLLAKERKKIFAMGGCGLVIAAALAFALPSKYTATASLLPPGVTNTSSASALMGQLSSLGGAAALLGNKGQGDIYVGLLKSESVARKMVERFHLLQVYKVKKESQAEKALAAASLFEVGTKDSIIKLSVTDKSPSMARDLAQGYLDVLQEITEQLALTESSQRRLFYERRLSKEKDELENAEVALKQSEEKTGLIAPAGQTALNIQTQAQLQARITDLQAQLAPMLKFETDQNSDVLQLKTEISSLQEQMRMMEVGDSKKHFGQLSTAQVPELELEYIRKAREVKYHQTLFNILASQYEAARIDESKEQQLQIVDRPTIPDTKSGPHRTIIMALGLALGLALGGAWVLLRARQHSGIKFEAAS
jgi:tyrosine-protein kinase Etk/Wzc